MDYRIQLDFDKNFDLVFINNFFDFLISRGIKYNARHEGKYYIFSTGAHEKDVITKENEVKESTDKLAEIVNTYIKFDLKTTSLSVYLDYIDKVEFPFDVSFHQLDGNKSLIFISASDYNVSGEKTFLAFVDLCKDAFIRFNFVYGSFRNECQEDVPYSVNDFLKESPDIVNFYSRPVVDRIGRDRILSAPAFKVEELENGGIMLLVCPSPSGYDDLERVGYHLGYKGYTG